MVLYSETISNEIFHLVQREIEQNYEMMLTDKKKIPVWAKRLHLAVKAYQELLNTLGAMDSATDPAVRESSKIIKSNIFYVPEYRETILSQLIHYDPLKMSRCVFKSFTNHKITEKNQQIFIYFF